MHLKVTVVTLILQIKSLLEVNRLFFIEVWQELYLWGSFFDFSG